MKTPKFEIGNRVAYSVQFLSSIGMSHSEMAHGRGIITALEPLSSETMLAVIDWEKQANLPTRVNTYNLAIVGNNPRFARW